MNPEQELRQNPVSGDWVLVAPGRAKRPDQLVIKRDERSTPKSECPFEDPQDSGNGEALASYSAKGLQEGNVQDDWQVQVIANKYPIVKNHEGVCPTPPPHTLYRKMTSVGFHEVVVFRDHDLFLSAMTPEQAEMVIRAYQDRIISHSSEDCLRYVLVFHNHGAAAGASLWHPHSQILALPIIPHDVHRSLFGSWKYFEKYHTCAHCDQIVQEQEHHERLVYHNEHFVVFVPFAPQSSFELRIFPIKHQSHFELITPQERLALADALVAALRRLEKVLGDPSYNFFIHTAPVDKKDYSYYHWHVEIMPKTSRTAGVELGLGIRVVTTLPEEAARLLREA